MRNSIHGSIPQLSSLIALSTFRDLHAPDSATISSGKSLFVPDEERSPSVNLALIPAVGAGYKAVICPDLGQNFLDVRGATTGSRRSAGLTAARRVLADVWRGPRDALYPLARRFALAMVAFRRAVG